MSQSLPHLVLLGTDVPELHKLLERIEEKERETVHEAYVVTTNSCAREVRLQLELQQQQEPCHGAQLHELPPYLDETENMFGQFDTNLFTPSCCRMKQTRREKCPQKHQRRDRELNNQPPLQDFSQDEILEMSTDTLKTLVEQDPTLA